MVCAVQTCKKIKKVVKEYWSELWKITNNSELPTQPGSSLFHLQEGENDMMSLHFLAGTTAFSLVGTFFSWAVFSALVKKEKKGAFFKYLGWGCIMVAAVSIIFILIGLFGP